MVNSKKLLSLFLAVVMLASMFTIAASAWTNTGSVVAGDMNFKYTVEKVSKIPATDAGSEEYTADNLYAVTAWMQSDVAVTVFTIPFHYNKTHFAPITLVAEGMTFPTGAELDQDTYYTDMDGDGAVYAYTLGDYMKNTGMYKASGETASSKALAKCIGLGNSNSAGIDIMTELVSPDHPFYASKWSTGLPADTGVLYFNAQVTGKTKTAYFNTIEGINVSTDWNRMVTLYFESLPGVTAEQILNDKFGYYGTDYDVVQLDGATDTSGYGYFVNATTAKVGNPNKNLVANASVSIVNPLKGQIRFDKAEGEYAGTFDVRALAFIPGDFFETTFTDVATAKATIKEVGFVFAAGSNVAEPSMDAVKALVENGTAADGYTKKTVEYISTSIKEGDYAFSCIVDNVTDAEKGNSLVAVGYLAYTVGDETVYAYYPAAQTISFTELFDAHYDSAFPG